MASKDSSDISHSNVTAWYMNYNRVLYLAHVVLRKSIIGSYGFVKIRLGSKILDQQVQIPVDDSH